MFVVCRCSVNYSNVHLLLLCRRLNVTLQISQVVQAHTLGEVGILGTVLLRAYSGTILPIFIQIGSYLTDKEPKISRHSFFETRCVRL